MKRFTFIFVLLLATATMMAEEFTLGKLKFETLSDTEVELVGADKGITNIYLNSPITYQGKSYSVTSIGGWAFKDCSSLTSITIPNSVTEIGYEAFKGTAFYNNPSNWNKGALYIDNCLITVDTNITVCYKIKENTRLIADDAFYDCSSLTSITIPNSVTSIGYEAFLGCSSLTSITIPNSVTSIGRGVFANCKGLTSITIPNSVTSIGDGAFVGCSSLTSITIPNSVKEIGDGAFAACTGLTSITIPNSVTSIGQVTFYNCKSLTSITIPNSVTYIEERAFSGCSSLTSITIPNSVTSIGREAFYGTAFYNNPSNWDNGALYLGDCLIRLADGYVGDYNIKENTRLIANDAFAGCSSLTSVTIPNSVTSFGFLAFDGCTSLTSIVVEQGNAKYDSRENCNAIIETATNTLIRGCQNTTIPNSVKSIGDGAFYVCTGLTSITIPNSVTSIGYGAFLACTGLTSITIPNSVTEIKKEAFYFCDGLKSVKVPSHTEIAEKVFPSHTRIIRQ